MVIVNMHRVIGNAVSILASDVINRATTFILYALVARYLGAFEFGQLSLALTLFYTFQVLAVAGLKTLITREVAKDTTKTDRYLVNGSIVVIVSSLLSIAFLLLIVRLMNYSSDTSSIILLLSLGLLPYSLSAICEAVFQAWEKMQYIAYSNMTVNVVKVGLVFLTLSWGYGLYHLVVLIIASQCVVFGLEWLLMLRCIVKPRISLDVSFSLAIARSTTAFLGMDGIIAIMASFNFVLLSKLTNEKEVGLYNASTQLMAPVILICQSIVLSVFPVMCRRFESSLQSLKRISDYLIELLLAITLPIVVGLFFLADSALLLLYRHKDFVLASGALRIMVWNLILAALTSVLGQVLVASLREKVTLRIVAVDALINLVIGLILISQFGLIGAAITALLTRIVDFCQHYVPASRLLSRIALGRLVWKPVVASICMALYLAVVRSQEVLLTVVSAGQRSCPRS